VSNMPQKEPFVASVEESSFDSNFDSIKYVIQRRMRIEYKRDMRKSNPTRPYNTA
jgi:hypothetical protein